MTKFRFCKAAFQKTLNILNNIVNTRNFLTDSIAALQPKMRQKICGRRRKESLKKSKKLKGDKLVKVPLPTKEDDKEVNRLKLLMMINHRVLKLN